MTADGRAVANFILDFCAQRGRIVTNLTLQKAVYFCHVWQLVVMRRPLVKHSFEAWQHGPVLPYLYRDFKEYDSEQKPITTRAMQIDRVTGARVEVRYEFDEETTALQKKVVDFYSQLNGGNLVALSHVKGGPWYEVWNHQGGVNPGMKISDEAIAEYYSKVKSPFTIQ